MRKRPTRTAKETQGQAEHAEKQRRALEMRKQGWTYDQIGRALGYANRSAAHKAVQTALADIPREEASAVKKLELERLDGIYRRAGRVATRAIEDKDRVAALKVQLAVSERRSKLEGLDAPTKVDATMADLTRLPDEEFERRKAQVLAKLAAPG